MLDALTGVPPTFQNCTRSPREWKDEIHAAASLIAKQADTPLWLAFSGGIDSEIMCRAFFDQHIAFSTLIVAHRNAANAAEVAFAKQWCWDRGVPHEIVPFDTDTFFKEVQTFDEQQPSNNIFRFFEAVLLKEIEKRGGTGVIGDGGLLFYAEENKVLLKYSESDFIAHRYSEKKKAAHVPAFFRSTPEVVLSYLHIPLVDAAISDASLFVNDRNCYLFKRFIYQALFPDLAERPKRNMFGEYTQLRRSIEADLKKRTQTITTWKLPVSDVLTQLQEN